MFMRIHFDAASFFLAMVIKTSITVTLKHLRRFRRQCGVALEWALFIKMFKFSFEKNDKCTKLDKNEQKRKRRINGNQRAHYFWE